MYKKTDLITQYMNSIVEFTDLFFFFFKILIMCLRVEALAFGTQVAYRKDPGK